MLPKEHPEKIPRAATITRAMIHAIYVNKSLTLTIHVLAI